MESRKNAKELDAAIRTLAKQISKSLNYSTSTYDKTFISVIQSINSDNTYNIIDEYGTVRNVVLALPNVTLRKMYISGVHPQIINR